MDSFIRSTMYGAFIPLTILTASTSVAASTSLEAFLYDGSQYVKEGDGTSYYQLRLTASMSEATRYNVALDSKTNGNIDTSCIEDGDIVVITAPDEGRVGLAHESRDVYSSHHGVDVDRFYIHSDTVGCIELMDQVQFESHEEFWPENLRWLSEGDVVSTNTTGTTYQLVKNVISVAKSGGDFNSITDALNSISDASETNPYLISVAPGHYDEQVSLKSWVRVNGSGVGITVIAREDGAGGTCVTTANNASISNLSLTSTGGFRAQGMLVNHGGSFTAHNLDIDVSGGSDRSWGVAVQNGSSAEFLNVSITSDDTALYDGLQDNYVMLKESSIHAGRIRRFGDRANAVSSMIHSSVGVGSINSCLNCYDENNVSY